MPDFESLTAITALLTTIAIAKSDTNEASKVLGHKEAINYDARVFSKSRGIITGHEFQSRNVSSTKAFVRVPTSVAFLFLAYKEHKPVINDDKLCDADIGIASSKRMAWALCGITGLPVGTFGPYRGFIQRPLEQRLRDQSRLTERET